MEEQRRYPRLTLPLDADYIVEGAVRAWPGRIQNLSAAGTALLVLEPLQPGTSLASVRFLLPAEDGNPARLIDTPASVVRVVGGQAVPRRPGGGESPPAPPPAEEVSGWLLGLEFAGIRSEDRRRIKHFVDLRLTRREMPPTPPMGKRRIPFQQVISLRFEDFKAFVQEVSANISETGMFLTTRSPQPPGSAFEFQFTLGDDFSLIEGEALVVWVRDRPQGPDKPGGMGVRFLRLDSDSQPVIRRLVARYQAAGHKPFDLEAEARAAAAEGGPEPMVELPRASAPEEPVVPEDPIAPEEPMPPAAPGEPADRPIRAAHEEDEGGDEPPQPDARLAEVADERDKLRDDLAILLALRDELEGLLERSRGELEAAREEAGRHAEELGGRLEAEAARADQLTTELERERAERLELESQLAETTRSLDAAGAQRAEDETRLLNEADSLRQHLERLEAEAKETRLALESEEAARSEAEERSRELLRSREEEEAARSEYEAALHEELESLRRGVAALEGEHDGLRLDLQEKGAGTVSGEEVEGLTRRLEEAAQREEDLRSQLDRLRSSWTRLEDRLNDAERRAEGRPETGPVPTATRGRWTARSLALMAVGAVLGGGLTMLRFDRPDSPADENAAVEAMSTESLSPPPTAGRPPRPTPGLPAGRSPSGDSLTPDAASASKISPVPDAAALEETVRAWADAWSEQRVDDFLDAYSRDFSPPRGASRAEWEAERRRHIEASDWIRVTLQGMVVEAEAPGRALVQFDQLYLTPAYGDQVRKRLELVLEDGEWKIAREEIF